MLRARPSSFENRASGRFIADRLSSGLRRPLSIIQLQSAGQTGPLPQKKTRGWGVSRRGSPPPAHQQQSVAGIVLRCGALAREWGVHITGPIRPGPPRRPWPGRRPRVTSRARGVGSGPTTRSAAPLMVRARSIASSGQRDENGRAPEGAGAAGEGGAQPSRVRASPRTRSDCERSRPTGADPPGKGSVSTGREDTVEGLSKQSRNRPPPSVPRGAAVVVSGAGGSQTSSSMGVSRGIPTTHSESETPGGTPSG